MYIERVNGKCEIIIVLILALIVAIFLQIQIFGLRNDKNQQSEYSNVTSLYDLTRKGAVEILADGRLEGSGWFVDSSGLVMTADHVIGLPGKTIEIVSHSVGRVEAQVVAVDRAHDLALLQLPASSEPYPSLPLADKMPLAGTAAFCYGVPLFRHDIMVNGCVARNDTVYEWIRDQQRYLEIVHFSAQTPKGISGGPWIDCNGQVIGLQSGMLGDGEKLQGVAYVISIEAVNALINSKTTAKTPTLGISCEEIWEQSAELRNRLPQNISGLFVKYIMPDGPADSAKLQRDDVIVKADSRPMQYRDELLSYVRSKNVGDKIKLTIVRPDTHQEMEVELTLDCLEKKWLE